MNVLLTGGSGFVARYLENHLNTLGYKVYNVSRSTSPSLETLMDDEGYYDYYVHTAGLSKDSPFEKMEPYMKANVELSLKLFKRFQRDIKAKRFIFLSSLYALDDSENATCYAKSKAMVELELLNSRDSRVQIIRPALICAPPLARGILGALQKMAVKGIGVRFPKGFHMKWVSIETIASEIQQTLSQTEFTSILNLIDDVTELQDLENWLHRFETKLPKIIIKVPKEFVVIAFNIGHLMRLPLNRYFLKKLQSSLDN